MRCEMMLGSLTLWQRNMEEKNIIGQTGYAMEISIHMERVEHIRNNQIPISNFTENKKTSVV